mgnify:CR=1 FL=1
MRLAASVETELPLTTEFDEMPSSSSSAFSDNVSSETPSEPSPPTVLIKRERRSIVFDDAQSWRLDFTRLDDGEEHSIEVELQWPIANERLYGVWRDTCAGGTPPFDAFMMATLERELLLIVERIETTFIPHELRVTEERAHN